MFINYKAVFLNKIKGLKLNGQSVRLAQMVYDWIESNYDAVFASSQSARLSHFSNRAINWPVTDAGKTISADLQERSKQKDLEMLREMVDALIRKRKMSSHDKRVQQIKFKLTSGHFDFEEKNNYFQYQIEDCIRYFESMWSYEFLMRKHLVNKVKKDLNKIEMKMFMQ